MSHTQPSQTSVSHCENTPHRGMQKLRLRPCCIAHAESVLQTLIQQFDMAERSCIRLMVLQVAELA